MRRFIQLFLFVGLLIAAYAAVVHAQGMTIGPAGPAIPQFAYGTSGVGALPSCTATANVPSMDGELAVINNQINPIPVASQGGITPQATGALGIHAFAYCDATLGKWFLLCP